MGRPCSPVLSIIGQPSLCDGLKRIGMPMCPLDSLKPTAARWVHSLCDELLCFIPLHARQAHSAIVANGKYVFLSGEAIARLPELGSIRLDMDVQPAPVRHLVRLLSGLVLRIRVSVIASGIYLLTSTPTLCAYRISMINA